MQIQSVYLKTEITTETPDFGTNETKINLYHNIGMRRIWRWKTRADDPKHDLSNIGMCGCQNNLVTGVNDVTNDRGFRMNSYWNYTYTNYSFQIHWGSEQKSQKLCHCPNTYWLILIYLFNYVMSISVKWFWPFQNQQWIQFRQIPSLCKWSLYKEPIKSLSGREGIVGRLTSHRISDFYRKYWLSEKLSVMGITQGVQVDIATRPECSQNWEQVFVECDTTGLWQDQRISKDRDEQKGQMVRHKNFFFFFTLPERNIKSRCIVSLIFKTFIVACPNLDTC